MQCRRRGWGQGDCGRSGVRHSCWENGDSDLCGCRSGGYRSLPARNNTDGQPFAPTRMQTVPVSLGMLKILREMGIPDHLTCLLRNLYAGQEATVRTGHGTTDWFQRGKGVRQGCRLSPCLFNLYAEYIMRNAGLEETQAGIKIAGEISITSDMQITPPLPQKVKRN